MKSLHSLFSAFFVLLINVPLQAQKGAKFMPPKGKNLLIVGQDIGSIGGFKAPNNNGYVDHVMSSPGGVTTYTSFPNLDGLESLTNYGAGDVCGQCIVDNPVYDQSVISVGLYLVDQLELIVQGEHDETIRRLGKWIKGTKRPVFLRIGYEFDGAWNHYDPAMYQASFRRMVDIFRDMKVTNVATVWQSGTSPVDDAIENKHEDIADWYPGDEYVDWMAYSWFLNSEKQVELTDELVAFARLHKKPVMVAEAADQGYDNGLLTRRNFDTMIDGEPGTNLRTQTAQEIWTNWYTPFFDYIKKNKDAIHAVAYIDCNWDVQPMWGKPYSQGYWGDTRVESNPFILQKWKEEIAKDEWLHGSSDLFSSLGY